MTTPDEADPAKAATARLAEDAMASLAKDAVALAVAVRKHERLRLIHAPDGFTPARFCTECKHVYPCLTIRILDGQS